ncbi:MAG: VCBS repeat-containing protein [Roseomonas sp.]|nr:VCBS repeat-containing protein [Roseomonas sp.]
MSITITGFAPSVTFAENTVNAAPQLLDSNVVFTAGDSLAGGQLVVGGLLAEDRVSILSEGNGAGQIGVSGSTISYGGVAIGTASGGMGSAFIVTFNSGVTGPAVDALIQRLAYANVSDAPTATRDLTLDVVDASGVRVNAPLVPAFTELTGSANPFNGVVDQFWGKPSSVDLDGDGRLDLVAGEYYGTLQAWRNTGSATAPAFTALTGSDNPFNGIDVGNRSAPSFVDLDGDGLLDLVSGKRGPTLLAWRNTGSATAPAFTALTGSDNPFNGITVSSFNTPSFVDLDGDGLLDLVSGETRGALSAWRNTGSAGAPAFTALTGSANPFNGIAGGRGSDVGYYSAPSFVDLDGDGRLDLVSGAKDGTLRAWRNTGSAGAPAFTALTGGANPFNGIDVGLYSAPSFVDLDGDGRLDLVSGDFFGRLLAWRNTTPLPSITVTVTAQNEAPSVTSGGTASFGENGTGTAYQAVGSDPEGTALSWSLGGTDAVLFNINATSGAVTFKAAPDFEAPGDAGGDNVYDITVTASDSVLTSAPQAVAISVTDVTGPGQTGTSGPDALTVGAENARLSGLGGNDTLTGGAGRDTLDGGDGNDVFVISDTLDLIIETAGGGADTIMTSVSMAMPVQVETLQIAAGISGITITGGSGNDMLIGNGLANTFVGGAGDDVILAGNVTLADIYALFAT